MIYQMIECPNGLPLILSPMPEAPRMVMAISLDGGILREPLAGVAKMADRLLTKGTTSRSSEQLALELDERAIDLREMTLADCSLLMAIFLDREFEIALDVLRDVLLHSTFDDFDKERVKLIGEIQATLDLPAEQANDLLTRTLFPRHPYGNSGVRMMETLPGLQQDAVHRWFGHGLHPRRMNVTLVGNFEPDVVIPRLQEAFGSIAAPDGLPINLAVPTLPEDVVVAEGRPDANQAQVYQGWLAPALGSEEQAATAVMNTILGGAGLSARLFTELRDKQGLAYSVRSSYTPMRETGEFVMAIGTSPENIARARQGFTEQLTRMQQEPITLDELHHAKGRIRGSFALGHETAGQRALDMATKQINGFSPDYSVTLLERIEAVTIADVQAAAQQFAGPSVTAMVAREDALPG